MAHTEIGREVVEKFLRELEPWGHPDSPSKLIGRSINVMVSPHPKHKRAKNPTEATPDKPAAHSATGSARAESEASDGDAGDRNHAPANGGPKGPPSGGAADAGVSRGRIETDAAERGGLGHNPFSGLSLPTE
jgi:hypothetical protein